MPVTTPETAAGPAEAGEDRDITGPAQAGEVGDTAGLLVAVAEWMRHSFEATAARFDLTPAQARALLGIESALPMRSLAHHLHCDASNVTGIVDRLEAGGLVAREVSAGDRRVKLLVLTPKGAATRARLETAVADGSPITTTLTADERQTLQMLLAKVVAGADGPFECGPPAR